MQGSDEFSITDRHFGVPVVEAFAGNDSRMPALFERRWTAISSPSLNETRSEGRTASASACSRVFRKRVS
jgi:hypothetical protein